MTNTVITVIHDYSDKYTQTKTVDISAGSDKSASGLEQQWEGICLQEEVLYSKKIPVY